MSISKAASSEVAAAAESSNAVRGNRPGRSLTAQVQLAEGRHIDDGDDQAENERRKFVGERSSQKKSGTAASLTQMPVSSRARAQSVLAVLEDQVATDDVSAEITTTAR